MFSKQNFKYCKYRWALTVCSLISVMNDTEPSTMARTSDIRLRTAESEIKSDTYRTKLFIDIRYPTSESLAWQECPHVHVDVHGHVYVHIPGSASMPMPCPC
jgi:hypothetical protein